jgi:hypothetical protein
VEIAGREVRTVFVNLALRNRMTERSSHFAGLWIGAAISNTSHSNKAGSTTVKRARLTGKGSMSTTALPQQAYKFPYRATRDVSLLSGQASYIHSSLQKVAWEARDTWGNTCSTWSVKRLLRRSVHKLTPSFRTLLSSRHKLLWQPMAGYSVHKNSEPNSFLSKINQFYNPTTDRYLNPF